MEIIEEDFLEETAAELGFESSLCLLKKSLVITFKAHPEYPGGFPLTSSLPSPLVGSGDQTWTTLGALAQPSTAYVAFPSTATPPPARLVVPALSFFLECAFGLPGLPCPVGSLPGGCKENQAPPTLRRNTLDLTNTPLPWLLGSYSPFLPESSRTSVLHLLSRLVQAGYHSRPLLSSLRGTCSPKSPRGQQCCQSNEHPSALSYPDPPLDATADCRSSADLLLPLPALRRAAVPPCC